VIGTVIEGKYTVEALLGEGGMAAVYRVKHNTLGTTHALKILTLARKSIRQRLLTEGIVQASLDHPNAVAVRDVVEVDGQPALLMEFVEGPDLEDWILEGGHSLQEAEHTFRGILSAVGAAHDKGLIHRDLKPANVLMARRGTTWVPKVCDFGIAKLADEDSGQTSGSTRTGVAMGTPAYMAPEQIRDAKNVDHRADIFSLGCILYQLVTGIQPFQAEDIVELYNKITKGQYTPPLERVPTLPKRIVDTIRACLEVDRDRRPDDCAAILKRLDGQQMVAPPLPPSFKAPPTKPRNNTPIFAAAVAAGALLVGGGIVMFAVLGAIYAVPFAASYGHCGGLPGQTVGYAKAGAIFLKRPGQTWIVQRTTKVVDDYPREGNEFKAGETVICSLPSGTKVELRQEPIKHRGTWIAIEADAIAVPEPDNPENDEEE